jgi:predicted Na+-dependent transporter
MLFLQTTVAVGALSEVRTGSTRRWAWSMFVRHHVFASVPLIGLGLAMGLDTPWGVGTFLLGAAPTAIALPSNVAACGGQVRPVVQFTLIGYGIGVVLTPAIVLLALGSAGRVETMVVTLLFGLIAPAMLGVVARPWLQRLPRRLSFTMVATSVLVLMLGMGSDLREALILGLREPAVLGLAFAIGFGRVAWGAALALRFPPRGTLVLEAALAGGGKNAVLAAVIAGSTFGPLAALPALLSLFAEISLLFVMSGWRRRSLARAG